MDTGIQGVSTPYDILWSPRWPTKNDFQVQKKEAAHSGHGDIWVLKFMFSKKATKIDEIFTVDLTLCSKCQIDGEDFVNFCGLLRKHEL